jgi:hypothetical protein
MFSFSSREELSKIIYQRIVLVEKMNRVFYEEIRKFMSLIGGLFAFFVLTNLEWDFYQQKNILNLVIVLLMVGVLFYIAYSLKKLQKFSRKISLLDRCLAEKLSKSNF